MKALFVGSYNRYTTALMTKLSKNGVGLAVVNNAPKRKDVKTQHTKYTVDMRYVKHTFDNYRPDIVVFTSAYDDADFLDDLKDVLTQGAMYGLKRLIFLSSTIVYGLCQADGSFPDESAEIKPSSRQGLMFAAGEDLCRRWENSTDMKVTILRVSCIYGKGVEGDVLDMMLENLLNGESVVLPHQSCFAPIHVDDMSEAVMQVVESGFSPIYNLSSSERLSGADMMRKLELVLETFCGLDPQAATGRIKSESERTSDCRAADSGLFRTEYQWHERHSFAQELPDLGYEIQTRLNREEKKKAKRKKNAEQSRDWLGFVETTLLFVFLASLTRLQQSAPLIGNVDFVILYLVLIAVTMTPQLSALSVVLSCGLLVFDQLQDGRDLFTIILSSDAMLKSVEYCIVGVSVSYVIQRLRISLQFAQLKMDEQENEMRMLEQFSDDNLRSRQFFEDQILEYEMSLPRITAMAARLDTLEPECILPDTVGILSEALGVDDVAAYLISQRGGRMRLSFTQTSAAVLMGQSPLVEDYQDMVDALEKDRVYVNRGMNPHYPSMATGVKIDGKLAFVFVVWNIPFGKMRLDTSNLLQAITRLVSAALYRSYRYEHLTHSTRFVEGTNIMTAEAFSNMLKAGFKGLSQSVVAYITGPGDVKSMAEKIDTLIRENDHMGLSGDGRLMVMLSGTGLAGYRVFESRLAKVGLSGVLREESR